MSRTTRATLRGLTVAGLLAALIAAAPAAALAQEIEGTWESRYRDDNNTWGRDVQLNMSVDRGGRGRSQNGFGIAAGDLQGIGVDQLSGSASDVRFKIVREAGTVSFEGDIRNGRGAGLFRFTPSDSYLRQMDDLGYGGLSAERVYLFALQDVTTEMVRELQALGYTDLNEKELVQFAIHGVSPDFIREMNQLGYSDIEAKTLVQLRIHGVSPEYVRRVREALGT